MRLKPLTVVVPRELLEEREGFARESVERIGHDRVIALAYVLERRGGM